MHFPLTCYLRCEICIYNLLDSGSSGLICSLLLVGVGTYMALQKVFDFMRWKAVKTQQFASLFKQHTYASSSKQRPSKPSIARDSTAIQAAEQPHSMAQPMSSSNEDQEVCSETLRVSVDVSRIAAAFPHLYTCMHVTMRTVTMAWPNTCTW